LKITEPPSYYITSTTSKYYPDNPSKTDPLTSLNSAGNLYKTSISPQIENDEDDDQKKIKPSFIDKLINNIQRLSKSIHKLNKKSFSNDKSSSIGVYNFYGMKFPHSNIGRKYQVSIVNCAVNIRITYISRDKTVI
jgi:hypothetical protein